jgi:hypothetical protein
MQIISFLFGLPVLASLASALPNHKRDILTDISLFAYGTNISGLSVVVSIPLHQQSLSMFTFLDMTNTLSPIDSFVQC